MKGLINSKLKIILFIIFLFGINSLSLVNALNEIEISISIKPLGIISKDYNVVGDIFTYNLSLFNNNSEPLNNTFTIEIIAPENRSIAFGDKTSYIFSEDGVKIIRSPLQHEVFLNKGKSIDLIPYINLSINKDTKVWSFDVSGDYNIKICSSNHNIKFVKNYKIPINEYSFYRSYYFNYDCFTYSFSAMPKWQYELFQKEYAATQESLDAAKKTLDANQKLLDLNTDLDTATKSMLWASWLMFLVALITLWVSLTSKETVKESFKMMMKMLITFLIGLIMLAILLLILNKILFR